MKAIKILVSGHWAHFKKPETNNNPLSHDFITKTALIGMMGAVLGIERNEMKELFPKFCKNILYNVRLMNEVKKESWGFTLRKSVNEVSEKAPKYMEFLKEPNYEVIVSLKGIESQKYFLDFIVFLKQNKAIFTPVLGLHNCPANIELIEEIDLSEKENDFFETFYFVSKKHSLRFDKESISFGFDRIPTFQNNDFWNLPDKYVEVVYPSNGKSITVTGDYYKSSAGDKLWLI